MTLTLKTKLTNWFFAGVVFTLIVFGLPGVATAQGLELSVTPTLFEMAASPGQVWNSSVKVINTNPFPLTVYAQVMNFAPQGEGGQGRFVPVFESFTEGSTLAEWITIETETITIPPEQSYAVPFSVHVPEDASPGGHFAAILIGTKPPDSKEKLKIATSQIVTSLFFVRVGGDVIESGTIREFTAEKKFVQEPSASFALRFENKGNVHIQPQGQIEIMNMWGKERGVIPINSKTHFGNVLPDSIRRFEFSWKGEPSITDIGRYKASVTLGYGLEGKKFESASAYFYVVPLKPLFIVLGSLLFAFWFISWAIRAYVRHMLALSGVDVRASYQSPRRTLVRDGDVLIERKAKRVSAPLKVGMDDLKERLARTSAFLDTLKTLLQFVIQYKVFFGSVLILIVIFTGLYVFVKDVGQGTRDYEVTIDNEGTAVTLSSEDIIYERDHAPTEPVVQTETTVSTTTEEQTFTLTIINAGDVPGAAADLKARLESLGYTITSISSDFTETRERTVIIYDPTLSDAALTLSQATNNALLSAAASEEGMSNIVIYIGNDYLFE